MTYHKTKPVISLLLLLCPSAVFASSLFFNIGAGGGNSKIGEDQTLTLFTSQTPNITDTYTADRNTKFTGILSIGGGYRFNPSGQWQFALGGEISYINYHDISGVVHPLVNVAPDFDTLNYHFSAKSYLVMLNPTIYFLASEHWHPFAMLGLGGAWNTLSNYTETTPPNSTAGPAINPFRDNTSQSFAFAPGIGIEYTNEHAMDFQVRYQYVNAGNASLNTIVNQDTSRRFKSGTLGTHFLIFSLALERTA